MVSSVVMNMDLDEIIKASFQEFAQKIREKWIYGMEREAVSIFAMDHLLPKAIEAGIIETNSQIAIESRVPQLLIVGKQQKKEVCKDLVIWGKPYQNCWKGQKVSGNYPLAIIEWKANINDLYEPDILWLKQYTQETPTKVGYVVTVDFLNKAFILKSVKVSDGVVTPHYKAA